jgi:hypothetical protein
MVLTRLTAIFCTFLLVACTSPGAPTLKTEADISGPVIPKCQNVSSTARVEEFNTTDYLTTWGSAWLEGAMQGFGEGLNGGGSVADAVQSAVLHPATGNDAIFNSLPAFVEPFCRSYDAEFPQVNEAVAQSLQATGYPVQVSNTQIGVFKTGFVNRQQPMAQWQDNYVVTVTPAGLRTEVKVLRSVYISRDGVTYNQGISVGQNETWLFTQISDRLERMKSEPSPPPKPSPIPRKRRPRKS